MKFSIEFSDRQIDMILRASANVPSVWRIRFLEGVVDHLFAADPIEDADVLEAMQHVARRMQVNLS